MIRGGRARSALTKRALPADNKRMANLSIRDLWGRLTQKKEMKPEVKSMLLNLDNVYEPRKPVAPGEPTDEQRDDEAREAAS